MKSAVSCLLLGLFLISCAGSRVPDNLDPAMAEWQQTSWDAWPELVRDSSEVRGYFTDYRLDLTHFLEVRPRLDEYKQGYGCEAEGQTTVQFVVTSDGRIRAPRVVVSLGEACENAVLLFMKDLRIREPARVNGRPVPYLASLQLLL